MHGGARLWVTAPRRGLPPCRLLRPVPALRPGPPPSLFHQPLGLGDVVLSRRDLRPSTLPGRDKVPEAGWPPGPLGPGQGQAVSPVRCPLTAEPPDTPAPRSLHAPAAARPTDLGSLLTTPGPAPPLLGTGGPTWAALELGLTGPGADGGRPQPCPALCVTLGIGQRSWLDRVRPPAHVWFTPRVSVPHCTVHARRGLGLLLLWLLVGPGGWSQAPCCPPTKDACWGGLPPG